MAESTYHITAKPPVRALIVAAIASLLGAVFLVVALSQGWHVVIVVLAALLLAAGLVLCAAAFLTASRGSATLTLNDEGYLMVGSGEELSGEWGDVSRVTIGQEDRHLTIHHGPERRTHVIMRTAPAQQVADVITDIQARLKKAKG